VITDVLTSFIYHNNKTNIMKASDLNKKDKKVLEKLLKQTKKILFDLRFMSRNSKLQKNHKIKETKKDVARILTALNSQK